MTIVFRVVYSTIFLVYKLQSTLWCSLLYHIFKHHVYPLTILAILKLRCYGIHPCLYAKAARHIHEEYFTRAFICDARMIYSCRCLSNSPCLSVLLQTYIRLYPAYEFCRILSKQLLLLLAESQFKIQLKTTKYKLILHTWT